MGGQCHCHVQCEAHCGPRLNLRVPNEPQRAVAGVQSLTKAKQALAKYFGPPRRHLIDYFGPLEVYNILIASLPLY